jgi:hypothetical protein
MVSCKCDPVRPLFPSPQRHGQRWLETHRNREPPITVALAFAGSISTATMLNDDVFRVTAEKE